MPRADDGPARSPGDPGREEQQPRPGFLVYLVEQFLGYPDGVKGDGTYWPCPSCGAEGKFHVMPPGAKDRYSCWSCGVRGDELDFVKWMMPGATRQEVGVKLADLRKKFNGMGVKDAVVRAWERKAHMSPSSPGPSGSTLLPEVEELFRDLSCEERRILVAADRVLQSMPEELREAVVARCVEERMEETKAVRGVVDAVETAIQETPWENVEERNVRDEKERKAKSRNKKERSHPEAPAWRLWLNEQARKLEVERGTRVLAETGRAVIEVDEGEEAFRHLVDDDPFEMHRRHCPWCGRPVMMRATSVEWAEREFGTFMVIRPKCVIEYVVDGD
jgi:ribosomal protein S27AE